VRAQVLRDECRVLCRQDDAARDGLGLVSPTHVQPKQRTRVPARQDPVAVKGARESKHVRQDDNVALEDRAGARAHRAVPRLVVAPHGAAQVVVHSVWVCEDATLVTVVESGELGVVQNEGMR